MGCHNKVLGVSPTRVVRSIGSWPLVGTPGLARLLDRPIENRLKIAELISDFTYIGALVLRDLMAVGVCCLARMQ